MFQIIVTDLHISASLKQIAGTVFENILKNVKKKFSNSEAPKKEIFPRKNSKSAEYLR